MLENAGTEPLRGRLRVTVIDGWKVTPAAGTVWLCRPGSRDNPCLADPSYTTVSASGSESVVKERAGESSKFDCFYVYPTVSKQTTENANLHIEAQETSVAISQASRFSQVCKVYAPMYPQVTLATLNSGKRVSTAASIRLSVAMLASESYVTTEASPGLSGTATCPFAMNPTVAAPS